MWVTGLNGYTVGFCQISAGCPFLSCFDLKNEIHHIYYAHPNIFVKRFLGFGVPELPMHKYFTFGRQGFFDHPDFSNEPPGAGGKQALISQNYIPTRMSTLFFLSVLRRPW